MRPYRSGRVLVRDTVSETVFQILLSGHPEQALMVTTPIEPNFSLDAFPALYIETFGNALLHEFALDYTELIWLFFDPNKERHYQKSYVQILFRWDGDKFIHWSPAARKRATDL
jgi:hypothetical protein